MAEGIFPKVNGDILYASEVNRFSPKLIGKVEQMTFHNISGTNFITLGTNITYPGAGSMQISEFMQIQHTGFQGDRTADTAHNFRLRISGAGMNITTATKVDSSTTGHPSTFPFNHILTSGVITASGGNIGSPYVISFEGKSNLNATSAWIHDFVVIGY